MITKAQFDAVVRLLASMKDAEHVKNIDFTGITDFTRVTFDAGWGQLAYDIDKDGNSAHVAFGGVSEISEEAGV